MRHVDEAGLHAYLDGELPWSGEDPAVFERHLEGCADCRARLEEARRLREHARSLLGGRLPVDRPPFDAVLRRARARSSGAWRRRGSSGVWAATVVLALAGGWLARGILGVRGPILEEGGVQVSSVPGSVPPGAAVRTDTGAGPPPPAAADAEPTPPREPLAVSAAPRSAGSASLTVQIPPVALRVEPEPTAAPLPSGSVEDQRIGMIEGTVTDESGRVIPGAAVQVRGLQIGTLTRSDGSYSLAVPEERTRVADDLVITATALGWEAAKQPLTPTDDRVVTRDFRLRPAEVALEGIVVVGADPAGRVAGMAEDVAQAGAEAWSVADREEIRRLLGRDALTIAGMRILETAIGEVDGIRTVRVRQELPGGAVCTLLQRAAPRDGDAVSAAVAVTDGSPSPGSRAGMEAEAMAWRDGVRIVARAPLSADSLAILLESLR